MDEKELWEEANIAYENFRNDCQLIEQPVNECKHTVCISCYPEGDIVCQDCGACIGTERYKGAEWNNYKDETGNYTKNTQRGEIYIQDNPYETTQGCLVNFRDPLMLRLQISQMFNHKQKTYWLTTIKLEHISTLLRVNSDCLTTAKKLWHYYMESGVLTRASVREGVIATCLYYACIYNTVPINRAEIINVFNCTSKCLSRGEKVMCGILESIPQFHCLIFNNVKNEENNIFVKYCSRLNLPFYIAEKCKTLFEKNKLVLQAVTPKSASGGVIAFVIKKILNLKIPSKSVISKTVDVCTPTINKVLEILEKAESGNVSPNLSPLPLS